MSFPEGGKFLPLLLSDSRVPFRQDNVITSLRRGGGDVQRGYTPYPFFHAREKRGEGPVINAWKWKWGGPPGMKKENSRRSFDLVMQSVEGLFVCLYLSSYTHKLGVYQLNDSLHDVNGLLRL